MYKKKIKPSIFRPSLIHLTKDWYNGEKLTKKITSIDIDAAAQHQCEILKQHFTGVWTPMLSCGYTINTYVYPLSRY